MFDPFDPIDRFDLGVLAIGAGLAWVLDMPGVLIGVGVSVVLSPLWGSLGTDAGRAWRRRHDTPRS